MYRGRARSVRAAPTLPLAVACLGALLSASAAPATDRLDPVQGARRLRQLAGRLAPLPDTASGITRDVGQVAVVEHDGSNYDATEPDGLTPNYAARAAVARRFYETHGDFYDFLVVFTNFEFQTKEAFAFHSLVRNDVRGIGVPLVDNGPAFGSPGRLKGYIDMGAVSRYAQAPLSLDPADAGFTRTLNVLAHEAAHQWLAEARFRDATGAISDELLKGDGHWSYLLDSDASLMYGADWVRREDGRYVAARVQDTYSSLDLYLMGLLDAAKVTPFTLLRSPAVGRNAIPAEGDVVAAAAEAVTVDQVIAAEGPRSPGFPASPKAFRMGFIFLTRPATEPSAEDLQSAERIRRFFAGHFFALTPEGAAAELRHYQRTSDGRVLLAIEADFNDIGGRLRARAMTLMQDLDRAVIEGPAEPAADVPAGPAAGTCPECGTANDTDARFCKQCGHKLESRRR